MDENAAYLSNLAVQTGMTVLMATNNLTVTESTCHSVTILHKGRVLAGGRTDQVCCQGASPAIEIDGRGFSDEVVALLLRRPEVAAVHHVDGGVILDLAARVDTAPLVSLLVESGVAVSEVRKSEPSLKAAVESLLRRAAAQEESP